MTILIPLIIVFIFGMACVLSSVSPGFSNFVEWTCNIYDEVENCFAVAEEIKGQYFSIGMILMLLSSAFIIIDCLHMSYYNELFN